MNLSSRLWMIGAVVVIATLAACSSNDAGGPETAGPMQERDSTVDSTVDSAGGGAVDTAESAPRPERFPTVRRPTHPPAPPRVTGDAAVAEPEEVLVTASRAGRSNGESLFQKAKQAARPDRLHIREFATTTSTTTTTTTATERQPFDLRSSVLPGEELWVIAQAEETARRRDDLGIGSMVCLCGDGGDGDNGEVPMPLEHTAVSAAIDGFVSSVNVRQAFANPFDSKIEAVYLFPLPQNAAVSEFVMIIGDRHIRGILREKQEAKRIYAAARSQGLRASLLVQHRPNVFEQRVANIEPGKSIEVDITYFSPLAYRDGWYSFVFPTVVGPRFNPPGSTDPIAAVPRDATPSTTAVNYLAPEQRSGHDISIDVSIDAGVTVEEVKSSHRIKSSREGRTVAVSLATGPVIPNRDFVLDFRVAGETMKSNLITHMDEQTGEGYFAMMLYPPEAESRLARRPMEMVFVLDTSGSMRGAPMAQAKAAMRSALRQLRPSDTFQIIRFSERAGQLGPRPLPASKENVQRGLAYVNRLSGGGGTMMTEGIKAALDFPEDPERLRFVTFMTDGYIGNETEILAAMHERIGASRVFSFGVGSSVNRYLMERMARVGRGAAAFLPLDARAGPMMERFFARISQPALTDLEINWGNMLVSDVYPASLPDVYVGRPVFVTGRYAGTAEFVSVTGRSPGAMTELRVEVDAPAADRSSLAKIWARQRIAELSDRHAIGDDPYGELVSEIRETALEHQLMSAYTSFVAVDTGYVTEGAHGTTVRQAVPVPGGVRYDTTVPGGR